MNTSFWALLALGFLLIIAAIAIKVIAFFTAEPKVTVDYLAEYNKISKPDGFDPNDNAAELYQKASEVYVRPSESYDSEHERFVRASEALRLFYLSNKDINEEDIATLKKWFDKNSQCMEYLKEGNKKKFFWFERYVGMGQRKETEQKIEEKSRISSRPGDKGTTLFEQRAKVAGIEGRFRDALDDLIDLWKIGQHYSNPKLYMSGDQIFAMSIKDDAMETAFRILDYFKLDANELRLWQEEWQKVFDEDTYHPGFQTERLHYYDYIQRNFVYHPKGKGRLAWKKAKDFDNFEPALHLGKDGEIYDGWEKIGLNPRYSCLFGATSNEVKKMVDYICEHYEKYGDESPWYWFNTEEKFQKEIKEWRNKHLIPDRFPLPELKLYWLRYHRLKAKSSALVTVIALLRYKADHGNYPKNLEVLRPKDGYTYLPKLPKDPFSEGLLVYHWLFDDFELYSVGPDFKDDGGKRIPSENFFSVFSVNVKGDDVFWPPFRLNRENVRFMRTDHRP
jgi:hypothetical protein